MITIFVGYDSRERVAFDVATGSILRRESVPVAILPLSYSLPPTCDILTRPVERRDGKLWCPISEAWMATEFAIARFAVPFLQRRGFALFIDCDIVCLADIAELFALADPQYAVQVVKHDHQPQECSKMDGQQQYAYPRKNWSSVVLWNCDHPANKRLKADVLNSLPGRDLHRFCWLEDHEIGELPREWNHLVGVSEPCEAKIMHYTLGGPWLPNWTGGLADDIWERERQEVLSGV